MDGVISNPPRQGPTRWHGDRWSGMCSHVEVAAWGRVGDPWYRVGWSRGDRDAESHIEGRTVVTRTL